MISSDGTVFLKGWRERVEELDRRIELLEQDDKKASDRRVEELH
jgi:hypothetical protein